MKVVLVLLLSLASVLAAPEGKLNAERWVNGYDQPLYFQCPNHQSISLILSQHDNNKEDRIWDFSCKNTFSRAGNCAWSGYVNNLDQELDYTCPFGSVLGGMESYHDNSKEDRRWKYLCCQGEVPVTRNCKWSGYVNEFDGYLRWDAPTNQYLVGARSYHDNGKEDRRWSYQSCEKN
ncbi:hemagglutinin/amebocyte aggregation factor-like isoform 1-T1 [Pelodytes ibericus]